MTDTETKAHTARPSEDHSEGLAWLMSLNLRTATEEDRRRALAVLMGAIVDPDDAANVVELLSTRHGAYVSSGTWQTEWDPEAPTPLDGMSRALWPLAREVYRLALMQTGLRLAFMASVSTDEGRDMASLGDAAARIFAVLDEATA